MNNKEIQSQVLEDVVKWMKEFEWNKDTNISSLDIEKLLEKAISRTIELMEENYVPNEFLIEKLKEQNKVSRIEQKADFLKMILELLNVYAQTKVSDYSEGYSNGWIAFGNKIISKLGDDLGVGK